MNIQDKMQRAKKAVDSIATHDDADFQGVESALDELMDYAEEACLNAKLRRYGSRFQRFLRYWRMLGKALVGRA